MFRSRAFSGSLAANTIGMLALVGNAVFMTQYLQLVLEMSPFKAALWSLAPSLVVGGAAPLATALARRFDRAYVIGGAFVLAASGYGVLTQVGSLAVILVGSGLLAAGLVMVMTLVTEAVVGSVAPERAGSASAVMETCSEFGGALGIAILGSIGTAAYRADLPADVAAPVREGLPAATAAAAQLPPELAGTVLATARHAFTHSFSVVALVGTLLLLTTAIAATLTLRGTAPAETPAEQLQPTP